MQRFERKCASIDCIITVAKPSSTDLNQGVSCLLNNSNPSYDARGGLGTSAWIVNQVMVPWKVIYNLIKI